MRLRRVGLATLVTVLCGTAATAAWIDRVGTQPASLSFSRKTAVVVLGARVEESGLASKTLEARVMHGVATMAMAPSETVLLISGGVGTFGDAEADVGARLAVDAGVPDLRVRRERRSHSTHQNALLSAELLRTEGITDVVLVSDPYHLARARLEFERLGFTVQVSPVVEAPRHESLPSRAYWTLREVPALVRALINA
jgi:uncharacterized SAM-binding protein YcdF (DUF218 family)